MPQSFTDAKGKTWYVAITVNTLKKVRAALQIDLGKVVEDKQLLMRLALEPEFMVDVLYLAVQDQAGPSVDGMAFAEALGGGDGLEAAANALLTAIVDFFPKHRREPLMAALLKLQEVQAKASTIAVQEIKNMTMEKLLPQVKSGS